MKKIVPFLLFTTLLLFSLISNAQNKHQKSYLTKVNTTHGNIRGILDRVTDSTVWIYNTKGYREIPVADIKNIRLKLKKTESVKKYQTLSHIEINHSEEQSLGRSLAEDVAVNLAANTLYLAGQLAGTGISNAFSKGIINTLESYKIDYQPQKFKEIQKSLERYSLYYQSKPHIKEELDDIKRITQEYRAKYGKN